MQVVSGETLSGLSAGVDNLVVRGRTPNGVLREGRHVMDTIWARALPILREQLGERNYLTWIEPMQMASEEAGVRLEVPSGFFQEWVARYYADHIREAVQRVAGAPLPVRVVVNADLVSRVRPKGPLRAGETSRQAKPAIGQLVPHYTFATFVVGEANRMAHDAAAATAREPGRRFNPLFIHGGVGLGKTHLINALAHEFLSRSPSRRIACLAAETFMNDLISSLRNDRMTAFRERYRRLDMLILDDVQFLAGRERTQEEFIHTFNALHTEAKQIVLTSDKPAAEIAGLEQRLRSRFEGGLSAEIHPPTFDMRVAIVRAKAASVGIELGPEVASYLAQHSGASVRELEGMLTRVVAAASMRDHEVTLDLAWETLGPPGDSVAPVTMDDVIERVSAEFRVSAADLKSHRRSRPLTLPRQIAMYLCRHLALASFPSIGEKFGGRDHSTVMHAVRVVEQKKEADSATASLLKHLETIVRHSGGPYDRLPGERRHAR